MIFRRNRRFRRSTISAVIVAGFGASLLLAGCTETVTPPKPTPPTLTSSSAVLQAPEPTPTPTPTPTPAAVNPLTGLGPVPTGSVVAVKIDDTANGRPQRGIDLADIVYIEQAEGGLSRLVGVFATNKPSVEAVRSVRTSDPELLSQYGADHAGRFRGRRGVAADLEVVDPAFSDRRLRRQGLQPRQQPRRALQPDVEPGDRDR